MPFQKSKLRAANQLGAGSGLWTYKALSSDVVTSANYFNPASESLEVGDRIFVTLVTDLDKAAEAYANSLEVVVTDVSAAGVVTVEEL